MVPVHGDDVRGVRGSIMYAATDGQRRAFEAHLRAGLTEKRCFEILADTITRSRSTTQGSWQRVDVRAT